MCGVILEPKPHTRYLNNNCLSSQFYCVATFDPGYIDSFLILTCIHYYRMVDDFTEMNDNGNFFI